MKIFFWITLVALFVVSCASYKDVEFRGTENFKVGKLEGKKMSFTFDARLFNDNGYALKIKPCDLDVFIEGQHMGVVHLDHKVKIKRKRESLVHVPLTVELGPGALVKLALMKLKKKVNVRLVGTVKGGVWIFSKKEQIDETREISTDNLKLDFQ